MRPSGAGRFGRSCWTQFVCKLTQSHECQQATHRLQVHVRVKIPQKVGGEEKKLVEQLKTLEGSKEKAGSRWF